MTIRETIESIKADLEMFGDWEDRYNYIIDCGKSLASYPDEFRTDNFLVKGCQSKVWLHPTISNGVITFDVDSDAIIVRGLAALLMKVYNNRTAPEIIEAPKDIAQQLGLTTALSPSRANGLASMIKQLSLYAMAYHAKATA